MNDKENFFAKQFRTYYSDGYNGWMINIKSSHKYRFKFAVHEMRKYKNSANRSLEIACASGDFTVYLLKHYPNIDNLECIDICKEAIEICKKKIQYNNINFEVMGLPELRYDSDSFDMIWCMDVIYYLDTRERFESVREINRILKNDGIALFMIPYNFRDCSSIRRCINKYMNVIEERYSFNGLWRDFTVYIEKKYKESNAKSDLLNQMLSKIYIYFMKSTFLMNIVHFFNMIFLKNHVSHYVVVAKKCKDIDF